jgi:hypothetical protein
MPVGPKAHPQALLQPTTRDRQGSCLKALLNNKDSQLGGFSRGRRTGSRSARFAVSVEELDGCPIVTVVDRRGGWRDDAGSPSERLTMMSEDSVWRER